MGLVSVHKARTSKTEEETQRKMTNPTNRNEPPEEEEGAVQLLSQDSTAVDLESPESNTNEENEQRQSPRTILTDSLRAHTARLVSVTDEFLSSLSEPLAAPP